MMYRHWLNQALEKSADPHIWILQVFAVIFITAVVNFMVAHLWRFVGKKIGTKSIFGDALFDAAWLPIQIFIWLFGISTALFIIHRAATLPLLTYWRPVVHITFVGLVTLFFARFVSGLESLLVDPSVVKKPVEPTTASAIGRLLRVSIYVTAALVIFQSLGFSISGVLAFGGVGGLAVGFAAKDVLSNFLAALVLYIDKPFKVGDWVRSPDRDIEGTVIEIGWRATRIRKFDTTPVYVPNAVFTSIALENPSRMLNWRIQESWDIRFDDWSVVPDCIAAINKMMHEHQDLDLRRNPIVNFDDFSSSGMSIFVRGFTKTVDWERFLAVRQDVLLKIIGIIHEHGAEIAQPLQKIGLSEKTRLAAMSQTR